MCLIPLYPYFFCNFRNTCRCHEGLSRSEAQLHPSINSLITYPSCKTGFVSTRPLGQWCSAIRCTAEYHQLQTDLSKFFKPITETQKATTREITEGLRLIKEGIKNLTQAITFPAYPSIQALEKPLEGEDTQYIGEVAEEYLRKFTTKDEADTTYGLYDRNGNFSIGNKPVVIIDNNIVVDDEEYEGIPGLWELIVSKNPDDNIYTNDDYDNYARLMLKTNTLHRDNDPNSNYPKSSKGQKWKKILRTIWDNRGEYEESGVVFLPKDPNALLEMLDLSIASKKAGNTGVKRNYLVSILDEIKRQGVLDTEVYKKINSII